MTAAGTTRPTTQTNPGGPGLDTSLNDNFPFTGSDHDGTEDFFEGNSLALGSTLLGKPRGT